MKVRVFPMNGVVIDMSAEAANNLIKCGQAQLPDEKPPKKKKRKDRKGAPENKG